MWQYDPNAGDMVWVEPAGASANVPANIASLVPSGGTVQQNMAAQLQGYGAEGGEMSFNPDGTFTISTPLADNQFLNTIVDSSGKQISQNVSSGEDTGLQDLAAFAAIPLTAGGFGGVLGGALTGGALSGTAASALGNALISGTAGAISGQDPLKAALLAAGGTYAGSLFGGVPETTVSDAQFIAADAAQLAAQGIPAPQIEQVLRAGGVNTAVAAVAADAASSGMNVSQIAQDITSGNRGLFTEAISQAPVTPAEVVTSPEGLQTVTVPAAAPVASISDIVAAIPSAVLPQPVTPIVDMAPLEPVGLMAPEAPQAVEVTGTQQQAPVDNVLAAVAPLTTIVPPAATPPNEVVEVTAKKEEPVSLPTTGVSTDLPSDLSGGGLETADQAARTEKQDTGLTLKDLYTALQALGALSSTGLFGGGGGGGTQRSFVAPTATVPMGNADYYNAVQQYYNTYMPQTPRDVATPLQQWYEGKFGG